MIKKKITFFCILEVVEVAALSELVSSIAGVCGTKRGTCGSVEVLREIVRVVDLAGSQ